jgi:hypothetical protein
MKKYQGVTRGLQAGLGKYQLQVKIDDDTGRGWNGQV